MPREARWTQYKHGKRKPRERQKLHIGVSNELIVANCLSEDRKADGKIDPNLIRHVGRIKSIAEPTKYITKIVYKVANCVLKDRGQINIHPRAMLFFSVGKNSTETKKSARQINR